MKWNILVGSLVLGLGLCTQSFGFELLDRMLGISGGCGQDVSCCPTACPKVQCPAPCAKVKCPAPCPPKCAAPRRAKCAPCPQKCAAVCPPKCAAPCPPKCADPCKQKCKQKCKPARCGVGLLDRLFGGQCCAPAPCAPQAVCGCDGGVHVGGEPHDLDDDLAPMPPAPVVDPSAYLPSQRRVVQASSNLVR